MCGDEAVASTRGKEPAFSGSSFPANPILRHENCTCWPMDPARMCTTFTFTRVNGAHYTGHGGLQAVRRRLKW